MGGVFVFDGKNKPQCWGGGGGRGGGGGEPLLCPPYGVHIYYVIYSQAKRPITLHLQPDVS